MPWEDNAKEQLKQKLSDDAHVADELDLFQVQVATEQQPQATDISDFAQEVMGEAWVVSVDTWVENFVALQRWPLWKLDVRDVREWGNDKAKDALELTTIGVAMQLIGPVLFAEIKAACPNRKTEWFASVDVAQIVGASDIATIAWLKQSLWVHAIPLTPAMESLLAILDEQPDHTHTHLIWDYIFEEYPSTVQLMKESMVSLTSAYTKDLTWWWKRRDDIIILPDDAGNASGNTGSWGKSARGVSVDHTKGARGMPLAWTWWAASRTTTSDLGGGWGGRGFASGGLPSSPPSHGPETSSDKRPAWKTYATSAAVIMWSTAISAWIWNWIRWASPPADANAPAPANAPNGQPWFFARRRPWLLWAGAIWWGALYYFNREKGDGSPLASSLPAGVDPASVVVTSWWTETGAAAGDVTGAVWGTAWGAAAGWLWWVAVEEDIPSARPVEATWLRSAGKEKWTEKKKDKADAKKEKIDVTFLKDKHESVAAMYTKLFSKFWYTSDKKALLVDTIAQKMYVVHNKEITDEYDISTAYNKKDDGSVKENAPDGISSASGSNGMPAGVLKISGKAWESAAPHTVLRPTVKDGDKGRLHGEAPEEVSDPENATQMTSRILYVEWLESSTKAARKRWIYIHGTSQEQLIWQPASHGCIRMMNADVIALCDQLEEWTLVGITNPTDYGYKLVDDRGDGKRWYVHQE